MNFIFTIIFSVLIFSVGESQTVAQHYKTKDFDAAIFPITYEAYFSGNRFTPTKEEILQAEKALQTQLKEINRKLTHQSSSPVIHKNLKKYKRQYFGIIDGEGNKYLLINAFWDDGFDDYWLNEIVEVMDGGSYFWQIEFNYRRK